MNNGNPLVFLILLNYNGAQDTIECIESLNSQTYKNYKVIVVDNQSTDNSVEILRRKYPQIKLIETGYNGGFAYGNNIGIEYALKNNADYIILLNNDTIVEPSFISNMVDTCIQSDIKVLGCKINYFSNRESIWYCGGKIIWDKFYSQHIKSEGSKDIEEVEFITACCMMLHKEVLNKIKLPEEYFMYFEDLDYCVQLKDIGYKLMINPNITIYHKVSASSGGEESPFFVKYWNRNRVIFMNKYKSKVSKKQYFKIQIMFYLTRILKYIIYLISGKRLERISMIEGIKQGIYFVKNKTN